MGKIRRKFEIEFKRQLALEIESGAISIGQAARDHQLAKSLVEKWLAKYRNNTLVPRPSMRERQLEAEIAKLKAKVGDLVMQIDHIKKLQTWVRRQKSADTSVITSKNLDQFRKPVR
jgi:transposase-like protein